MQNARVKCIHKRVLISNCVCLSSRVDILCLGLSLRPAEKPGLLEVTRLDVVDVDHEVIDRLLRHHAVAPKPCIYCLNKPFNMSTEVKPSNLLGNYDRPTNQPTD